MIKVLKKIKKPIEKFKFIAGFSGYEISSLGRVYSLKRKKFLKPEVLFGGYLRVSLCKNGNVTKKLVHRLVAKAFLTGEGEVDHINGIRNDNKLENLQYLSKSENLAKRYCKTEEISPTTEIYLPEFAID